MKIQCDVCNKEEASVFCTADEAAICDTCDHRVHHANKLASKHPRFSLLVPSSKTFPICDICQEKRAFLFCQQDRAILCRDCDVPVHSANEHTQKHNRFLLTGVKLSATSAIYMPSSSPSSSSITKGGGDLVPNPMSQPQPQLPVKQPVSVNPNPPLTTKALSSSNSTVVEKSSGGGEDNMVTSEGICSTSSISEYLIEMLPGWHVEDFLDSPSSPFGFSKPDDGVLSFGNSDFGNNINITSSFSSESMGIWVPQASTLLPPAQYYPQMGGPNGLKETKEATNNMKAANRRLTDDAFTVPQISPPSSATKRSRPFW